jgi:hypothetical protein
MKHTSKKTMMKKSATKKPKMMAGGKVTTKKMGMGGMHMMSAELGGTIGDAPMKKDKMMTGGSLRREYSRPRGM